MHKTKPIKTEYITQYILYRVIFYSFSHKSKTAGTYLIISEFKMFPQIENTVLDVQHVQCFLWDDMWKLTDEVP